MTYQRSLIQWRDVEAISTGKWPKGKITVRCIDIIQETHDVKTFRCVLEPRILFHYKPGQFASFQMRLQGERAVRSYSMASTPSRPYVLDFTIKLVPGGLVSGYFVNDFKIGDTFPLRGPYGKFTCVDRPAKKYLFISAGSGVTPMMSMVRWLIDTAEDCDILFYHNAKTTQDIIYREELEMLHKYYSNFTFIPSITRLQECEEKWEGKTGRFCREHLEEMAPDYQERHVFTCGPDGLLTGVKNLMKTLSFPMEQYFDESFG